jgi:hypothetical protein
MRISVGGAGRWVVLAAALGLGGCDTLSDALGFSEDNTLEMGPTCPRVAVGDDVGYVARYDGNGTGPQNLLYAVKIEVPNGICYLNDTSIDVEMSVPMFIKRGPAMESREVNFDYWVAVARIDKTILARESYQTGTSLRLDEVGQINEEFDQTIPIEPGEPGSNFVIIVGLVLSEDELTLHRQPRIRGQLVPQKPAAESSDTP